MDCHCQTLSRNLVFYLTCISPGLRNVSDLSGGAEVRLSAKSQARCCQENPKQGVARKALADNFDTKTLTLTHPRAHWGKARGRGKPPRLDLFLLPSHRSSPSRAPDPSFSPASKRLLIRFPPSTSGAAKTTFLVVDPKWVSWEVSLSNTKHQQFQGGSFC